MTSVSRFWLACAWIGYAVAPWYALRSADDFATTLAGWPTGPAGAALLLAFGRAWWLASILPGLLLATTPLLFGSSREAGGRWLVGGGLLGLLAMIVQGLVIGLQGWTVDGLAALLPTAAQGGMGIGALMSALSLLFLVCNGLAARGWCRGDAFVVSSIGLIAALIGVFLFFPMLKVLANAFVDSQGRVAFAPFIAGLFDTGVWGLGCTTSNLRCGVAWNTLFMGVVVGVGTTLLGLSFALISVRTQLAFKRSFRVLSVLPIITPPFVIGLAMILIFGRSGALTGVLSQVFGIAPSRWIYGFWGILIAQLLAFTPIAYLVLVGVVQGISPSMEEASQTLRAKPWTTFRTVSFPLMRPGIANAFLLGFVESIADFGNPLVLGGNYEVLSIKIFFAVVGAASDPSRAATLSILLLAFTMIAFWAQQFWLGRKVYTTVTGKGDSGLPLPLPRGVAVACIATTVPWMLFTFATYGVILAGSVVRNMGRDYTLTLAHFRTGFLVEWTERGLFFSGSAWNSFFATLEIALIAAPLTAALGLLTGYLLSRKSFSGRRLFEFATMLSFAIPGTLVGVSYILAFNVPPIEITGTGFILVMCFVFRNMPVGVRSGIATMSQIDRSLDEASATLGARSFVTVRRVVLPLIRPAIVASLVYAFVRSMTAVSAVIFLVSAQYNMATSYIVGRVEAGEFGLAIAYSTVLIVVMLAAIGLIQLLVGDRKLGRRKAADGGDAIQGAAT